MIWQIPRDVALVWGLSGPDDDAWAFAQRLAAKTGGPVSERLVRNMTRLACNEIEEWGPARTPSADELAVLLGSQDAIVRLAGLRLAGRQG